MKATILDTHGSDRFFFTNVGKLVFEGSSYFLLHLGDKCRAQVDFDDSNVT
jgi:hypothetical protein